MVRFIIQRWLVYVARVCGAGIFALLLIELAYCVFGGSDRHVWLVSSYEGVPVQFSREANGWWTLACGRFWNSFFVILIAYGGTLIIGYSWGVLSARLSRWKVSSLLSLPFSVFACVPGFWFVISVAVYSYFEWQRPGFANEVVVETGPDLMSWWYAGVVALPLLMTATAWQIRAVSESIEREAGNPFVKGLHVSGYRNEEIFYANIMRQSWKELIGLSDKMLPFIMGGIPCLEWAFGYNGLGSLFIDSVRGGYYEGVLLCCIWVSLTIGLITMIRELGVRFGTKE
tara:strand:+ start:3790 stop:4647 length:858 start_codon:yes stop_codon:yes gene_type:complete